MVLHVCICKAPQMSFSFPFLLSCFFFIHSRASWRPTSAMKTTIPNIWAKHLDAAFEVNLRSPSPQITVGQMATKQSVTIDSLIPYYKHPNVGSIAPLPFPNKCHSWHRHEAAIVRVITNSKIEIEDCNLWIFSKITHILTLALCKNL